MNYIQVRGYVGRCRVNDLWVDTGGERGSGEGSVELLEVLDVESCVGLGHLGTEDLVEELSYTTLAE